MRSWAVAWDCLLRKLETPTEKSWDMCWVDMSVTLWDSPTSKSAVLTVSALTQVSMTVICWEMRPEKGVGLLGCEMAHR